MSAKFILIFFLLINICAKAQQNIDLANEYFKQGEYEKAQELYQKIVKDNNEARIVHNNYIGCLVKIKNYEEAEKFIKKQIKNNSDNIVYKADQINLLELIEKKEEAKKLNNELIELVTKNENNVYELVDYYFKNEKNENVIELIKKGRITAKNETKYSFFMARAYSNTAQKDKLIDEILIFGLVENNIDYVKATLQDNFKDIKEHDLLEKSLYSKVQKYPNELYYVDILIWYFLQQKEFNKAFVQMRALDRIYKLEGQKIFDLAILTSQNKEYKSAIAMYEYIISEYPLGQYYADARKNIVQCKEELIKNIYPIDKNNIRDLISEYQVLFKEIGYNQKNMDAMRNTAMLFAFYLDDKEKAVAILDSAINIAGNNQYFKDKCKLDLGDIFILKNEPWEATLLYSQVEKSEKEEQIGQEAKLRNAKLHYYNGEFELAKDILDVLKKATTREISNDAIQLSLLIQDNTGQDSTETAMKEYAAIELLLFQNKNEEAIIKLETLFEKYKTHSLGDEILWLGANTYLKINKPENAIKNLEQIMLNYKADILADDALFTMGKIYQETFNNKNKAMELYRELLQKYPGSIFGAEARKQFRNLRGDTIN